MRLLRCGKHLAALKIDGIGGSHTGRKRRTVVGTSALVCVALALAGCGDPASVSERGAGVRASQVKILPEPEAVGSPPRVRLLTEAQYFNSLTLIFGPAGKPDVRLPPPMRTDGLLQLGASRAGVTTGQMELYQKAAQIVSATVVNADNRDYLIPCKPVDEKAADRACAAQFLSASGRLLFRGAFTAADLNAATMVADDGATKLEDFYAGLRLALESMLISPRLILLAERSEPDPARPGRYRLDSYSLASRLSFLLWNSGPDGELIRAAESGELHTPKGLELAVNRMLANARVEDGVRAFFDDMLSFDDFNAIAKDPRVYPVFTSQALEDAREQTLRTVVSHLIAKNKDYRDLFTTRETFLSPALATLYRLPTPRGWTPYEFPADSPRVGLLGQVSFLAGHSHPARSSATLRGKALRELLLCQPVPPPPANVDFSAVENPNPSLRTARDRVNVHLENPVCAGCHKITDPIGLALENFDGAGGYRAEERGAPIDASGNLDGKEFTDARGLAAVLRDHPALPACLVRRVYSYATGGSTTQGDRPTLDYYAAQFAAYGYKLPDLLRTIAMSKAFSTIQRAPTSTAAEAGQSPAAGERELQIGGET